MMKKVDFKLLTLLVSKLFLNCRFLLRMWYYYFCFLLTVTIYLKVELLKCLVSVVQECNRLGKKVPHFLKLLAMNIPQIETRKLK